MQSEDEQPKRLEWLQSQLDDQLDLFRKRRRRDKRKAFALQMSTVFLSASITVLLGLRVAGIAGTRLSDVALTLGALITVLAAAEAFFHHRELWLLRTGTLRKLESLDRQLKYYNAGAGDQSRLDGQVDQFLNALNEILSEDYEGWRALQKAASDQSRGSAAITTPEGKGRA